MQVLSCVSKDSELFGSYESVRLKCYGLNFKFRYQLLYESSVDLAQINLFPETD